MSIAPRQSLPSVWGSSVRLCGMLEMFVDEAHHNAVQNFIASTGDAYHLDTLVDDNILQGWLPTDLPSFNGEPLSNSRQALITAFNGLDPAANLSNVRSPILVRFRVVAQSILTNEVISSLLNAWPLSMPMSPSVSAFVGFYLSLIKDATNPMVVVQWARYNFPSAELARCSASNSVLKLACMCTVKSPKPMPKATFWATLDAADQLDIAMLVAVPRQPGRLLRAYKGPIGPSKQRGNVIRTRDPEEQWIADLIPLEEQQLLIWESCLKQPDSIPFPLRLTSYNEIIPETVMRAFYESLIADDATVLRAIASPRVTRVIDGRVLSEALLDIFAYAGKVNMLLFAMVGTEFDNAMLDVGTIFRKNSHLTCMFKVFFMRFGGQYIEKVIKPLVALVDDAGPLQLKNLSSSPEIQKRSRKILFAFFNALFRSTEYIPDALRHFAAIIRAVASVRFNSRAAIFLALSEFFCVRFVNGLMGDPARFGYQLRHSPNEVMMPFTQLTNMPFTGRVICGRFSGLMRLNHHLVTIYPDLVKFIFALPDFDEEPPYERPSMERVREALDHIMKAVFSEEEIRMAFRQKYGLVRAGAEDSMTAGWAVGAFLMSYFKDNISD
jgi:hypothetical protein